ncbi:MAG: undecaprenyl/decaprenyl-phosphate alpha-N-acetylglucosaminyl 1-phosphate transferase, partial [Cyclobacteriaceae bacterium]|nr:undecaprenyl/decaprenyl-phosphate alpha-N-acetylglucosaminyl 1-phosphate transferase [Cyclobacteriaceae bacterium]
GLDGLAGSIASVTLTILGVWFQIQGLDSLAILSFTLLGGVLAFLAFNWHPAQIFMGDTGSLTLGFAMGSLVVAFMEYNFALPEEAFMKIKPSFTFGIALMIYPLYDMARVFARRISKGQHPMTADKTHIHHFLIRMGYRHDQVAFVLGFLHLTLIILVFGLNNFSDNVVLPLLSFIVLFLGYRLDKVTVKYVKKKVMKSPKVLEIRPLTTASLSKMRQDEKKTDPEELHLN